MNKIFLVSALTLSLCATAFGFTRSFLLDELDLEFQQNDNSEGRALGSPLTAEIPWESYNKWQCFELHEIEFSCADYNNGILVPSLTIETAAEIFLFDVHVEDNLPCHGTLVLWRELADSGNQFCVFAAHMPDVDLDVTDGKSQSLWYISRLKGNNGYWNLEPSQDPED